MEAFRPSALAQQLQVEDRVPRGIGRQRARGGGRYLPAGVRRAGHGPGIAPHDQRHRSAAFRGQGQPARGGKIERPAASAQFQHHGPRPAMPEAFHPCHQQVGRVCQFQQQESGRIDSQFGQAGRMGPVLSPAAAGPQPHERTALAAIAHAGQQGQRHCRPRRAAGQGIEFMQAVAPQAAFQPAIHLWHIEPDHAAAFRHGRGQGPGAQAQDRRIGHMFPLCSYSPDMQGRAGQDISSSLTGASAGNCSENGEERQF